MSHKPAKKIFEHLMHELNNGVKELEYDDVKYVFKSILKDGIGVPQQVALASLLTGIMVKGPTRTEICALVDAATCLDHFNPYEDQKPRIELPTGEKLVGALGSGKKGIKTMNISTPSGLVAATAGLYFAKPGSASASSVSGSADLMKTLGANLNVSLDEMIDIIKETRFGFFEIEGVIPHFDKVYGGKFYYPHALSFVLPGLLSPVAIDTLCYGLSHWNVELSMMMFDWYKREHTMVISSTPDGKHFIDELAFRGNSIIGRRPDQGRIGKVKKVEDYRNFGIKRSYYSNSISPGKTLDENVRYAVDALRGQGTDSRENIVALNAGLYLWLGGKVKGHYEGFQLAKDVIKSGDAMSTLRKFIRATGGDETKLEAYLK